MSSTLRGTTDGADCANCPLARDGLPNRPVLTEHPDEPLWVIVGDGPHRAEQAYGKPFCGHGGEIIDKVLARVGQQRDRIALTMATLCGAPFKADPDLLQRAAVACNGRLQRELSQWPGVPVLTLGGLAAQAVLPQATLDAVNPPTVPKSIKRGQKAGKAEAQREREERRQAAYEKKRNAWEAKTLHAMLVEQRKGLVERYKSARREEGKRASKPPRQWLIDELLALYPRVAANAEAATCEHFEELDAKMAAKAAATPSPTSTPAPEPEPVITDPALLPAPKPTKLKPVRIIQIAGCLFDVDVDGTGTRSVVPTVHPMMLLRGGGATISGTHTPDLAFVNLVSDASKVNALALGRDIRIKHEYATEYEDAERANALVMGVLDAAYATGSVAIDLETFVEDPERHTALMAYVAQIRVIGLATPDQAVSVYWELLWPATITALRAALASERVATVYHNGIYDRTVLNAHGFDIQGPWTDSLLAHHASFPGCAHNLQSVTAQFYGTPPWKSEFRNNEETPADLTRYNAIDVSSTAKLVAPLTLWIKRTKTEEVYELDKTMAEIASQMHLDGVPMDREVNANLMRGFRANIVEARRSVEEAADDPDLRGKIQHHLAYEKARIRRKGEPEGFAERYEERLAELQNDATWKWNIGASADIGALLKAQGALLHQKTASGATATKKDILEGFAHMPIVRDILNYRENATLLATFVRSIFDRTEDGTLIPGFADGNDRVHPTWSIHKITGRWASSEPVMSNVPKDKSKKMPDGTRKVLRPNLRAQVVAPEGRMFVGFDFSQLEAKLIALISGDPWLCDIFATGKDIHTECAKVVFPKFDLYDKTDQKQLRDGVKPLEYGAFYGGAPETLWKAQLKEGRDIKLADVQRAVQLLMSKMEGVVRWQRACVLRASEPPHEITDFDLNRRRTFPLGQVDPNEAINFGVQASGATVMNRGFARMRARLRAYRQAFAILQIHDAAVFECWEDDVEALSADVKEAFTQTYERNGYPITFNIDLKIGKSWAEV